jgi:hypothetical protein
MLIYPRSALKPVNGVNLLFEGEDGSASFSQLKGSLAKIMLNKIDVVHTPWVRCWWTELEGNQWSHPKPSWWVRALFELSCALLSVIVSQTIRETNILVPISIPKAFKFKLNVTVSDEKWLGGEEWHLGGGNHGFDMRIFPTSPQDAHQRRG